MMNLTKFKVTNFKSIADSGWIECDDVTTLVGINEAGKSNVILALWKLNPAREGDIDLLHDLPNKEYAQWRDKTHEIVFISAMFSLDLDQKQHISSVYGKEVDSVLIERYYDGNYYVEYYEKDNEVDVNSVDKNTINSTGHQIVETLNPNDYILQELPRFVYYSNYGNLDAQIYLPHVIKLLNGEKVAGFNNDDKVRTLRVLFEYVGLEPQEVLELGQDPKKYTVSSNRTLQVIEPTEQEIKKATKSKEERATLLNSASAKLTKEFKEWWKQGEYRFRLQADGDFFKIWVSDDKRTEEIELERRSTGLQWFLSFYLTFLVESRESHKGAILLLDEAGLTLHPMAQKDLASFFENLSKSNQLIHTTHSPFLIDTSHIDRVKVVYSDEAGLTVVSSDLRASNDKKNDQSIYAVHSALGLTVSDILLQGCQTVIVEGPSDQYYFNAIKQYLIKNRKSNPRNEIVFVPSGGVKGIAGITGIVGGKNGSLPYVILDSDKSGKDAKNKLKSLLYAQDENKLLEIGTYSEITNCEVEDIIPFRLMARQLDRFFREVEDEYFEDVYDNTQPIVPQIENFARRNDITLEHGWKVILSKSVKKQLEKETDIDKEYVEQWKKIFAYLNKE